MADCFIIMPITVRKAYMSAYSASHGSDHFKQVLKRVFTPAVKKAGFKPLPPDVAGSKLIHAEIVHKLETADMVLCDMSTLNANVFFELGIRTAVNKPVCMVKDDKTKSDDVPFDNQLINYYTYDSSLLHGAVSAEVKKLTKHIKATAGDGRNQFWEHFSLAARGQLQKGKPEDKGADSRWPTHKELEAHGMALAHSYGVPVSGVFVRHDGSLEVFVNEEAFATAQLSAFMSKLTEQTGKPVVPVPVSPLKE